MLVPRPAPERCGSFCRYTFPFWHSGQASPGFSVGWVTSTFCAPRNASAAWRPCPGRAFSAVDFRRGRRFRCRVRVRRCRGHIASLLRAGAKQNLPQPLQADLPVLQRIGQIRQGFNRRLELFIVLLPQRLPHPRQDVFEFLSADVDPHRRGLHSASPSRARKSFTSGYPSTSLIDRLGRLLGQFFPRPVVRPITTQFAAR